MSIRMSGWTLVLLLMSMVCSCQGEAEPSKMWMGANVKVSPRAPWGSPAAQASLRGLAGAGADRALLVAFVWQARPESDDPVLGADSDIVHMRAAVRQARAAGLKPVIKAHLWIPGHWAGDAAPADRARWFAAYQRALLELAGLAEHEHVDALVVGTELRQLQDDERWPELVAAVRKVYHGQLVYVADGMEHAEAFRYWRLFDVIGTSLYPRLPEDRAGRQVVMRDAASRLQRLGEREGRPVWVAELGLRSARGALAAPWESPEQRSAAVDTGLQEQVLNQWRDVLQAQAIAGIAIWCWYTDPAAGGSSDSDFTVQNKPALSVFSRPGSAAGQ